MAQVPESLVIVSIRTAQDGQTEVIEVHQAWKRDLFHFKKVGTIKLDLMEQMDEDYDKKRHNRIKDELEKFYRLQGLKQQPTQKIQFI